MNDSHRQKDRKKDEKNTHSKNRTVVADIL